MNKVDILLILNKTNLVDLRHKITVKKVSLSVNQRKRAVHFQIGYF